MNNMLEIGDIIEMTIPGSGCSGWSVGAKAEIVGTGREDIFYARFLCGGNLLELSPAVDKFYKKVEGSKIVK